MYSHEIEELLKRKQYLVTYREYLKILDSEQIWHVKYENDYFYIETTDNYKFKLKVQKEY